MSGIKYLAGCHAFQACDGPLRGIHTGRRMPFMHEVSNPSVDVSKGCLLNPPAGPWQPETCRFEALAASSEAPAEVKSKAQERASSLLR
jgi:hypothetical protein